MRQENESTKQEVVALQTKPLPTEKSKAIGCNETKISMHDATPPSYELYVGVDDFRQPVSGKKVVIQVLDDAPRGFPDSDIEVVI